MFVVKLFHKFTVGLGFGGFDSALSFHGLGLIYSGYHANMLALILIFTYVIIFFRLLDKWSSLGFFALLGVSVLVLFSHSWTGLSLRYRLRCFCSWSGV